MNIFVIDDEYYARKAITKLLKSLFAKEGIFTDFYEFTSAEKTMEFLREKHLPVDVVFTDIRMDAVDGLELCAKLRQYDSDINLVVISGYEEFTYAQRAIKHQVLAYLTKPMDPQDIQEVVQKILKRCRRDTFATAASAEDSFSSIPDGQTVSACPEPISLDGCFGTSSPVLIDAFHQKLLLHYLSQNKLAEMCETAERCFATLLEEQPHPRVCSVAFLQELTNLCSERITEPIQQSLSRITGQLALAGSIDECRKIFCQWLNDFCENIHMQETQSLSLAEKALQYIEQNYSYDLRLETIAAKIFYVHPNYLSKVLKKEYGRSFSKLLLEVRMKKALLYLQQGNLNISTVAQFVGYNSESHFVQMFKKYYGYTPGSFVSSGESR